MLLALKFMVGQLNLLYFELSLPFLYVILLGCGIVGALVRVGLCPCLSDKGIHCWFSGMWVCVSVGLCQLY